MTAVLEAYKTLGISEEVYDHGEKILAGLAARYRLIDEVAEINQLKVLNAFHKNRVSEAHLNGTTGYGYNDLGRDALEKVYADVFHTEDALVRPQIACGTHALTLALSGNLRPGDELLLPAGKPYDTLEKVIGIRESPGSLAEYGVTYRQIDLTPEGDFAYEEIKKAVNEKTKMAAIQRSRGYQNRRSLSVDSIGQLIAFLKKIKPDIICMVDNCYGEFVDISEPSDAGADLCVGSLIKNPGGGLAPLGGYVAGRREYVAQAAYRLTSPGLGKEVGASLDVLRSFYQGLFLAPAVTAAALKGAVFAARIYGEAGFVTRPGASRSAKAIRSAEASPSPEANNLSKDEEYHDIIQAIELGTPEAVIAFCQAIQAAAPVDAHVRPVPAPMPGYEDPVIMASGSFISGSSIELSADGPLRPPYTVYFQGGLSFPHVKMGILLTLQSLLKKGLIDKNFRRTGQ